MTTDQPTPDTPPKTGIPVTILTGFLGAGKTTLLNHILGNQKGLKVAVLVNEFGEIGIDNDLIVTTSDAMVELSNGCICCSINGELMDAMDRLLAQPQPLDYVIVETTGLADPLPVAMTFLSSELRDECRLDSIITLVDAENFSLDLLTVDVGRQQIVYGDILLLNKTDLVSEERLKQVERSLRDIKPDARILPCRRGDVPLGLLLSVGLFDSDRWLQPEDSEPDHGHGQAMATATGITITTTITITLRREKSPAPSRGLRPSPSEVINPWTCALFSTFSTISFPGPCFAPRAFSGFVRVSGATFSTLPANAFPLTTTTGLPPCPAPIVWF